MTSSRLCTSWHGLLYTRNALTPRCHTWFLKGLTLLLAAGGDDKVQLLKQDWSAVTDIDLEQKPFSDVLKCIYSRFGCRHGSRWYQELEMENKDAAKAEVEKLETHDWLHSVLKKALQNIKWMETGDGRVEQEVLEDDKLSDGKTGEKKKIYAGRVWWEALRHCCICI